MCANHAVPAGHDHVRLAYGGVLPCAHVPLVVAAPAQRRRGPRRSIGHRVEDVVDRRVAAALTAARPMMTVEFRRIGYRCRADRAGRSGTGPSDAELVRAPGRPPTSTFGKAFGIQLAERESRSSEGVPRPATRGLRRRSSVNPGTACGRSPGDRCPSVSPSPTPVEPDRPRTNSQRRTPPGRPRRAAAARAAPGTRRRTPRRSRRRRFCRPPW